MRHKLAAGAAILAILVVMAFFYQSATFSSRSGEDTPLYSVRRHDPYGIAALHDLLVARGVAVRTLERPSLEPTDHGVLIQVLADSESSTRDFHLRTPDLVDWISGGNTVVQLTRSQTDLLKFVKISPATQPSSSDVKALQAFERDGGPPGDAPVLVSHARTTQPGEPRLMLWSPMFFDDQPGSTWKSLARIQGDPHPVVAVDFPIGRGKLVFVGAPTPALNGTIEAEGNLDFLLNLIGNNPVILDEWSHGIGHERTVVSFLRDVGLVPMLLQAVLVVGLYVWSTSGHGRSIEANEGRQRSSVEQIETLGYLYSRSLGAAVTFDRVNQEVQRRLAGALRCQPKELATRLAALNPQLRAKIEHIFAQLTNLRAGQGVRCTNCGYNLSFNESGQCPECGAALSAETRGTLSETRPDSEITARLSRSTPLKSQRPNRTNAVLADVLSASHQLALEITRDRRSAR